MRIVTALALLALLVGSAYADPSNVEPKPWENQLGPPRTIVPEAEPNDVCPGQGIVCGDVVQPAMLLPAEFDWYSFSANAGDVLTIGTDAWNASTTDTYIELSFNCGPLLIGDDDSGPGFFSLISNFNAPSTGTYTAKVRGFSTSSTGEYKFFVTCTGGQPPPPNDQCAGAIDIPRCTQGNLTGDLFPYANNYDPLSGGCTSGFPAAGKDAVYKVVAQPGDMFTLSYTQLSADASFYIVTDCANVPASCVAGADNTVTGQAETISYTATVAGTYYLILDCYGTNAGGAWTLTYNISCGGPTGACCVGQVCTITTQTACPGTWQGAGTTCNPNPCIVIPVEQSTWGQIKANYR